MLQSPDQEDELGVVDEDGNLTGKTVGYFTAHTDGIWHQAVHVWVYNDKGEILLQKRSEHVFFPKLYDISVGGHIEDGEEPRKTAIREFSEEMRYTPKDSELKKVAVKKMEERDDSRDWKNNEFAHIYLLKLDDPAKLNPDPDEVASIKWLDHDQFSFEVDDDLAWQKYVPHDSQYYHFIMALVREQMKKDD